MRYFLRHGEEADRIREGAIEKQPRGGQVFTDPQTGERWESFLSGMVPIGPFWSGLVRHPFPDSSILISICRDSDDFDEVAAASLALDRSVDTRWRLLDLVESLLEQSSTGARVQVLLDHGVFEFPTGHSCSVGMSIEEISRQYELSKRCAERSIAIRKRLSTQPRPHEKPAPPASAPRRA